MSADVTQALDLLMRIASGELGARSEPPDGDDEVAALVAGLNMLAEELDHERARRREAEALLADERHAYDRSPAFLCSVDARSLCVLRANDTLAAALGLTHEALVGRPVASLFAERDRAVAERTLRAAAAGSVAPLPELSLAGERGCRVTTTCSLTDDGARLRLVWRDVTRERQLEAHLLQAQKMQAVGRLSGGIAHDFNNILAVILASTGLMRGGLAGTPALEDLALIEQAAQRAAGLTAQLLSFSRQQMVRPQLVDVGALVRDLERMLRRLISESLELSIIIDHDPVLVRIDPSQLTQVLINLVVNARDAVGDHGRIVVELSRCVLDATYADIHLDVQPGDYALIAVSDNGHGMTPEILAQVFEPFFTTKEVGQGSGLGLSVCYGVVRQASGHIYAYSEPGRGTTFKVYLPLADRVERHAAEHEGVTRDGHERIVLVEDDPHLRQLTTRLLERAGYRVLGFANGVDAIDHLASLGGQVDLLVTDVVMPRMGGRELAEQLLGDGRIRAVLYVSGYTANSIVHNGILEDHVAFLAKPFTSDQLLRAVRAILDKP